MSNIGFHLKVTIPLPVFFYMTWYCLLRYPTKRLFAYMYRPVASRVNPSFFILFVIQIDVPVSSWGIIN